MSEESDWPELLDELLQMIAQPSVFRHRTHLFQEHLQKVAILRRRHRQRLLVRLSPLVCMDRFVGPEPRDETHNHGAFLSRASFFRVTLSLASAQRAWLIKFEELESGKRRLLCPLSRRPINHSCHSLDLLKYGVSEIQQTYDVKCIQKESIAPGFKRVVALQASGETQVLGIGCDEILRYWNGKTWTKIKDQIDRFCDIIVHKGLIYSIYVNGIVWWVTSSLCLVKYSPWLSSRGDTKSFVESRGELYVVDQFHKRKVRKGQAIRSGHAFRLPYGIRSIKAYLHDKDGTVPCKIVNERGSHTVGFRVYKLDEEWGKWIEVKSLGDRAFVLATDCCFSVSALEFYGCLENSIYFTDEDEDDEEEPGFGLNGHDLRVFKLDDGSINKMESCCDSFHMFSPCFLKT